MKVTMTKQNVQFDQEEEVENSKDEDKATVMKEYIAMVVITMISYYVYYTLWLANGEYLMFFKTLMKLQVN